MGVGMRVFYSSNGGTIIAIAGEIDNEDFVREEEIIHYLDIPYGFDFANQTIIGVDVENNKIIVEEIKRDKTNEERIRELEDALLLQTENEIGGIL